MAMAEIDSRAGKPAHPPKSGPRVAWFYRAGVLLGGVERLAEALDIQPRSLRAKMGFVRGIKDEDLLKAADALDRHAAHAIEHAARLRREAAGDDT